MKLLRTIPWFTRLLVGLFLVAQFAGMASPPPAKALPLTGVAAIQTSPLHVDGSSGHGHHAQGHGDHGMPCGHPDHDGNPVDACCALHACCAGLLPPVVAIATETVLGELLSAGPDAAAAGTSSGRLDRPPRPQH
jgi:hypothetical protein